jgi:cell wall-associated NlpC family hydrolase
VDRAVIGLLLDERSFELARILAGGAVALALALLLAVATPIALLTDLPSGVQTPGHARVATSGTSEPPTGDGAPVEVARRYLGVPYVFGGANPGTGLDCSGLVQLVFRQLGIALPRTAQSQYDATRRVRRDELRPGDLVFFARTYADPHDWITHVGIYIGGGQQIDAPAEGRVVSVEPAFTGFWGDHFAAGGRVVRD